MIHPAPYVPRPARPLGRISIGDGRVLEFLPEGRTRLYTPPLMVVTQAVVLVLCAVGLVLGVWRMR
jgi:hypothetical protein